MIVVISINAKLIGNADEVSGGLKKDIDTKYIYITLKGLAGLGNKLKKLTKIFEEQSQDFYRKKRVKLKKTYSFREKMPTLQATIFKLNMKIGFLYELIYNSETAFDYFNQAYNAYTSAQKELLNNFTVWEVKAVGDLLREKLERHHLKAGKIRIVVELFRAFYSLFKKPINTLEEKEIYKEYKWRAEQHYRQAELLRECSITGDSVRKKVNSWLAKLYFVSPVSHISGMLKC